jgi:hypothetical protein
MIKNILAKITIRRAMITIGASMITLVKSPFVRFIRT